MRIPHPKINLLLAGSFLSILLVIIIAYIIIPENEPCPTETADKIIIHKARRRMMLMKDDRVICTYTISLGGNPEGHKVQEGDGRTPEGLYTIDWKNPQSKFHLSLRISYPNKNDSDHAKKLGVPPGGNIMIHGLTNGLGWIGKLHTLYDWTSGCIAVTNPEIEHLWNCVEIGTPVEIFP